MGGGGTEAIGSGSSTFGVVCKCRRRIAGIGLTQRLGRAACAHPHDEAPRNAQVPTSSLRIARAEADASQENTARVPTARPQKKHSARAPPPAGKLQSTLKSPLIFFLF